MLGPHPQVIDDVSIFAADQAKGAVHRTSFPEFPNRLWVVNVGLQAVPVDVGSSSLHDRLNPVDDFAGAVEFTIAEKPLLAKTDEGARGRSRSREHAG